MRTTLCATLLLLASSMAPGSVQAASFTFSFTGWLDSVDPALTPTFSIGQRLEGSVTFDNASPLRATFPQDPLAPELGLFAALLSLKFDLGGYVGSLDSATGDPTIQITDNGLCSPSCPRDIFIATAKSGSIDDSFRAPWERDYATTELMGPPVAGLPLGWFQLALYDETAQVFSTFQQLPSTVSLSNFNVGVFQIVFGDGSQAGSKVLLGHIDVGGPPASVPEPHMSSLLLLAALTFATRSRHYVKG